MSLVLLFMVVQNLGRSWSRGPVSGPVAVSQALVAPSPQPLENAEWMGPRPPQATPEPDLEEVPLKAPIPSSIRPTHSPLNAPQD